MTTPSIKEEFEKEWLRFILNNGSRRVLQHDYPNTSKEISLWAARWMAERCAQAQRPILRDMISRGKAADTCRQLASELGGGE